MEPFMDETVDEMQQVQDWLDGKISWMEMDQQVRDAIDEVMLEESEPVAEPTEEIEEPFTAEIVKSQETELLHKADAEHRYTLGPWYIPNRYDAHGEWTDADELQKALWEYVRSGDRGIRLQHNRDIVAGEWVEAMSFPTPITIGMNKDATQKQVTYPAGTVFLGVQWKPWAWEMVKAGKIQGFSIGGAAARIDMGMPDDAIEKASFGGDRSAAGRYAAEQRWKNQSRIAQATARYRAFGRLGLVGAGARVAEARRRREERLARGEKAPSIVERIKRYFSEEYTNPKPLAQMEAEERAQILARRRARGGSTLERRGGVEAVYLPSGRTAILQDGKISTTPFTGARVGRGSGYKGRLSKAEIQVDARIEAFKKVSFATRSEAGRYAANMRWMRESARKVAMAGTGEFALPSTPSGVALGRSAPSLLTHADLDAIASELDAKGLTTDSVEAPLIVYSQLSRERQRLWKGLINDTLVGVPQQEGRQPNVYLLGGGGGAGKSSSPKGTLPLNNKNPEEPREAALINSDDYKEKLPLYNAMQESTPQDQEDAAGAVHEESSFITAMATTAALQTQRDVVLDGTFDNGAEKALKKLDIMRGLGAGKIFGFFFSCDTDEAQGRAVRRYEEAKAKGEKARFVPIEPLRKAHIAVSKNFQTYVESGKFDSIVLTDTNGAKGEEFPMFTWDPTKGAQILNSSAYQRFLDKQNDSVKPPRKRGK